MPYVIARNKYAIVTKQSRWNLESAFLIETRLLLRQLADRNDAAADWESSSDTISWPQAVYGRPRFFPTKV